MTRAHMAAVLLLVCSHFGCGDDDDGTAPQIDSLAPARAAAGDTIDVVGRRFCGPAAEDVKADGTCTAPPAGIVTFAASAGGSADADAGGGEVARGQIVSWKGTRIQVKVPGTLEPGALRVTVTVNTVNSNARDFTLTE